jgi:hypothetical protein
MGNETSSMGNGQWAMGNDQFNWQWAMINGHPPYWPLNRTGHWAALAIAH